MKLSRLFLAIASGALVLPLWAQPPGPGPREGRGSTWEDFAARHDLDGDGQVTQQEFAESAPRMEFLDVDVDGVITEADFEAHHQEMARRMVVQRADTTRSGQVTQEQWSAFLDGLDPDGDGRIEIADLWAGRGDRGRRHRGRPGPPERDEEQAERAERMASALDLDGDEQLTRNDFELLFQELDEDGDGLLLVELPPHRGKGRAGSRRP